MLLISCQEKDTKIIQKAGIKNTPVVIVKDTNVILGDSVHVLISIPGYATNPVPCISIDSINGVQTEKEYVIVHEGTGYYNELSTKEGTNVFAGSILAKEKNSNKVDTFHFRGSYGCKSKRRVM